MPILVLIGIASFAVFFAEVSGIMQKAKYLIKVNRLKPFDCPQCLSTWMAIAYCFITSTNIQESIFITGSAPIAALLILRLIKL